MRSMARVMLKVAAIVWLTAGVAGAQSTATSTQTKKFQVLAVDGNVLLVRLPEGPRELTVPDDFKLTVNGTQMSVRELKPGMAGTATITTTTTTTPVTVTEVKNGKVHSVAGSGITVRTEQGFRNFSQSEIDKRGVKIYKGGKPVQLSDLHTGDTLTATIVTTMPPRVMTEQEVQATLAAAPAAASPAARPTGTASTPAPAPSPSMSAGAAPSAARKLPKTAGILPLLGILGLALIAAGATLTVRQRGRAR